MRGSRYSRGVRGGLALALVSPPAIAACQLLVPLDDDGSVVADASASEAAVDGPPPAFGPCQAIPPVPSNTSRNEIDPPLDFAVYRWSFEENDAGELCPIPGLDIDGVTPIPENVCNQNVKCAARGEAKQLCDKPGGIDNQFPDLLKELRSVAPQVVIDGDAIVASGLVNALFRLRGYNGEPDDGDVLVEFYASPGMDGLDASAAAGTGFSLQQIAAQPPVWDGGQDAAWLVDELSVTRTPGVVDPNQKGRGYVAGGILVVDNVGEGQLPLLPIGGSGMTYSGGTLTAQLVKPARPGERWKMTHARLAGRLQPQPLFGGFGSARDPSSDTQLCSQLDRGGPLFTLVHRRLCSSMDLPVVDGGQDAAAPCDAISFGVTFASVQSTIATDERGLPKVVGSRLRTDPPCPDYANGTVWCASCDSPDPARCDDAKLVPPPDSGIADADAGD